MLIYFATANPKCAIPKSTANRCFLVQSRPNWFQRVTRRIHLNTFQRENSVKYDPSQSWTLIFHRRMSFPRQYLSRRVRIAYLAPRPAFLGPHFRCSWKGARGRKTDVSVFQLPGKTIIRSGGQKTGRWGSATESRHSLANFNYVTTGFGPAN